MLVACLGGQTSDPGNVIICNDEHVSADEPVSGVSPARLAQTFAGSYTSTLRWMGGRDATAGAPVPDDQVTIALTYRGGDGIRCGTLSVPVAIEVTTRDSGIHEMGTATLSAAQGSIESARLGFTGNQVVIRGELNRSNGTVAIFGILESRAADPPGSSAQFPAAATSTGSGGSGAAP